MSDNQIVIIGGGLQGLATAFTLLQRGEEVLILERDSDVATSASFANAGMLTPSQSSPWNSPDDILQILAGIGKKRFSYGHESACYSDTFFLGFKVFD